MDKHIATIPFTDGVRRPVYEGDDGCQYVINSDGVKVYGVWFVPRDEPEPTAIADAAAPP